MASPDRLQPKDDSYENILDEALTEYFSGIAFDMRIDKLLHRSDYTSFSFSTDTCSNESIYPDVFGFNHYVPYIDDDGDTERLQPMTLLNVAGSINTFHGVTHSHMEFISHTDTARRLSFDAQDTNPFVVTHTLSQTKDFISPYDALRLFFKAHNVDLDPHMVDVVEESKENDAAHESIRKLWEHSAEHSGQKTTEHIIERQAPLSTEEAPIYHRFLHRKEEPAEGNESVTMVYEKLHKLPQLDSETVLRLTIKILNTGSDTPVSDAKRIVRSMRSSGISATFKTPEGVVHTLDTKDPDVLKQIVDGFDELLSVA